MIVPVDSLDDPRIAHYRGLKDRELARAGDLFIAEGDYVVRRLLASRYPTVSVLLSRRRLEQIVPLVPDGVPVYVGDDPMIRQILGFKFHTGVIAVGRRLPTASLADIFEGREGPVTLVVCPEVSNSDNMGSLIRISAAFGAGAMVLGERCHDPFWRQSIRVSMGTIFSMPLVRSENLLRNMNELRGRWGVQLIASVLDDAAEPLAGASRPQRVGLLFGNEAQGLDAAHVAACDRRVTIPMKLGTDSLNVSIAAALFLYHFTQVTSPSAAPTARPGSLRGP
jgi:tRNA G18 (ribose-2'-O)-methylase SpoU